MTVKRRSTKFTPGRKKKILELIAKGRSPSAAADMAGISHATLVNWREKAREGGAKNRAFVEFEEKIQRALVDFETFHLNRISGEMVIKRSHVVEERGEIVKRERVTETKPQPWQASAWMLQRVFPDRYVDRKQIEHSGEIAGGGFDRIEMTVVRAPERPPDPTAIPEGDDDAVPPTSE